MLVTGPGMTRFEQYENVTVRIESAVVAKSKKTTTVDQVAAVIIWKHRKCNDAAAAPRS
jgi:hypothetical protein